MYTVTLKFFSCSFKNKALSFRNILDSQQNSRFPISLSPMYYSNYQHPIDRCYFKKRFYGHISLISKILVYYYTLVFSKIANNSVSLHDRSYNLLSENMLRN